eukprot:COSAG02_NODE_700_length_18341_cov_52.629043_3_plen_70_part_00
MGHDECAALCSESRRPKRLTRGESFASGAPKAGASAEPTMTDIAEDPTEDAGGAEPAELQVEEPAAQQA